MHKDTHQAFWFQGFRQVLLKASLQGALLINFSRVSRERERGNRTALSGWTGANLLYQPITIHLWHANIADNHIGQPVLQRLQRFDARSHSGNSGPVLLEQKGLKLTRIGIVLDEQNLQVV